MWHPKGSGDRLLSLCPIQGLLMSPVTNFFFFFFFWAAPAAYGGSQARVESELQLPTYTTTTAMQDPSRLCDLHHSSRQHPILNPLSKAKDQTCILMYANQIR